MTVADVKCSKREVERDWRIVEITKRNCEHADAVERNDAARRRLVLLQLRGACEITFYHFSNFSVARKAQHDLVDNVLEDEILIVVSRC